MEQESFEDTEVAERLNASFIAIKVDKEERPDIDAVYMAVCQAITGSGGWPMTIFMTPEQVPFFAGTYFPKRQAYRRVGLMELLEGVTVQWKADRETLLRAGGEIKAALSQSAYTDTITSYADPIGVAARYFCDTFDRRYGGFGGAPKFPSPHNLLFLERYRGPDLVPPASKMVTNTLIGMYKGGIFDHIGFGFSRYSTDELWLVPHFEKMLYDNALMVMVCAESYGETKQPLCKLMVEKTLTYIGREMTSPEGGFYTAQDADSEGEEGKFYTFTKAEIESVLPPKEAKQFIRQYDISLEGNFEDKNIPNLIKSGVLDPPDPNLEATFATLRDYRKHRYALYKDDKILTAWNALMIAALAKASRAFACNAYLEQAERALTFLQSNLTAPSGELFINFRQGTAKGQGLLDDYAFLTWAHLELYEATFNVTYLEGALRLANRLIRDFEDPEGGMFLTPHKGEPLIFRPKEQYDGAIPSGNSVALWCFAQLNALTGDIRWRDAADRQLAFFAPMFARHPQACTFALLALMQKTYPTQELVCVVKDEQAARALIPAFNAVPWLSVLVKTPENAPKLAELAPFTREYTLKAGENASFYLCENGSCLAPFSSLETLYTHLK